MTGGGRNRVARTPRGWSLRIGMGLLLVAGVKLLLLARRGFNWDELHLLAVSFRASTGTLEATGRPGAAQILLAPLTTLPFSHAEIVYLGRGGILLLTALLAWGTFRLARSWFGTSAAWATLLLLLTETTFLERSTEIRTDTPAVALALWGASLCEKNRGTSREAWGFACMGLGLLFSQKAIYLVALFLVGRLLVGRPLLSSPPRLLLGTRILGATGAVGGVALVWMGILHAWMGEDLFPFLQRALAGAFQEARNPFYANTVGARWALQSVVRNPFFWALPLMWIGARGGMGMMGRASLHRREWACLGLSLGVLGVVAFHTARFPYLAITVAPFQAISAGFLWTSGRRLLRLPRWGAIPLLLLPLLLRAPAWTEDQTSLQREVMARAERVFSSTTSYYDPHELLFRLPNPVGEIFTKGIHELRSGGDGATEHFNAKLEKAAPQFYVRSWRIDDLPRGVRIFLNQHFLRWNGNLFVVGFRVDPGEGPGTVTRRVLVEGWFRVQLQGGNSVWMDDQEVHSHSRIFLNPGEHRITLPSPDLGVRALLSTEALDAEGDPSRKPAHLYFSYRE